MKTLTEFSTLLLRKAADAKAAAAGAEGDALTEAVATTMSVQPDRAARLLEALDIVGDVESVRLVRVFQGETGPHGSVSRGEFHYAVDRVTAAKPRRRDDRGDRRGGGGGGGGGRGGPGGAGGFGGGRDKPRGLGSLKIGAAKDTKDESDDRPGRGETPRAGIGWQLTAAPRDMREGAGRGRGGPRRGPGGPGGPRGDRRGPGGPGGERRGFGPGGGGGFGPGGGGGDRRPEGRGRGPGGDRPRPDRGPRPDSGPRLDSGPRPDSGGGDPNLQPLDPNQPALEAQNGPGERKPRRPRKPIGPDASGLGPDGQPWDPDRRRKRLEERQATVNAPPSASVEAPVEPAPVQEAPKE